MENQKGKNVAVIGFGYVGKAAWRMVRGHYKTIIHDPNPSTTGLTSEEVNFTEGDLYWKNILFPVWPENNFSDCDLAIVCVPTPMDTESKKCITDIVEETVKKLDAKLILIKSTVAPGTIKKLKELTGKRIVFSPEYIGESTYDHPYEFQTKMEKTPFLILGGDKKDTSEILDMLVPILGPKKVYYQVTAEEAELIKYMENTYFGVKVTFANEMRKICETFGVDYYAVRTGWALDPRVDAMHTVVFKDKPGFGGKCLPKDLNALVKASTDAGYDPKFLRQMLASNNDYRSEVGLETY